MQSAAPVHRCKAYNFGQLTHEMDASTIHHHRKILVRTDCPIRKMPKSVDQLKKKEKQNRLYIGILIGLLPDKLCNDFFVSPLF